jgi:hypothetical protein
MRGLPRTRDRIVVFGTDERNPFSRVESSRENALRRLTHQRQWLRRLDGRLPGISSRQGRGQARPSRSRDRWAIHPRNWPTAPFPASPTVRHTCTCRPMGSSSCSKPLLPSFFSFSVSKGRASEALLACSILYGFRVLGQKHGQVLIEVAVGLNERCPPGRYPDHYHCRLRHLTALD